MRKTMPLIRTYMYDSKDAPLEGPFMCMKDNASG